MDLGKKRIFHGPTTVGGIGWHLSNWQRENGLDSDCIVYSDNGFRQLFHLNLKIDEYGVIRRNILKLALVLVALLRYDIFHFYSGETFLPYNLDLPILKLFRKKMVMTYCGSDIRLVSVAQRRNRFHHLLRVGINHPKFDQRKKLKLWWHNLWIKRFTAIRELELYAAEVIPIEKMANSHWINNIGFKKPNGLNSVKGTGNRIPKIIHAPSEKGIKGTEYVNKALKSLRDRGLKFDYQELHGIPNAEVQKLIQSCDILVDQFLVGEIGTLAIEGMGLGKPVVAYLPAEVVDSCMPGCPVFNANIDDLADRLEILINDNKLRLELGKRGLEFTDKYMNYDVIQHGVLGIYQDLYICNRKTQ